MRFTPEDEPVCRSSQDNRHAQFFIDRHRPVFTRSRGQSTLVRLFIFWLAWSVLAAAILLFVLNDPLAFLGTGGLMQRLYWLAVALWLLFIARILIKSACSISK